MGRRGVLFLLAALWIWAAGCGRQPEEKIQDLDFTVVADSELPAELKTAVETRREEDFRLTYSAGQDLYLAVGYGAQASGGYSIQVKELYLTESGIVLDTELLGPEEPAESGEEASYPYIVLKIQMREEPVVFR